MAKKVFPFYLDNREREILQRVADRAGVSKSEILRRTIRSMAIDVLEPHALDVVTEKQAVAEAH